MCIFFGTESMTVEGMGGGGSITIYYLQWLCALEIGGVNWPPYCRGYHLVDPTKAQGVDQGGDTISCDVMATTIVSLR